MGIFFLIIITFTSTLIVISPSAPETVWVDDDYTPSTPGWGITHFADIPSALNAVATGGEVVVYAGDYSGGNIINKPVNLVGNNEPNITMSGSGEGFEVHASQVTISGFVISNGDAGIEIYEKLTEITITNNTISHCYDGIALWNVYDSYVGGNSMSFCSYSIH